MSGVAHPSAPVRRSAKRDALVAAIRTVHERQLPKPPNAVLARLCGYATDTQVCHAVRRLVEAGRLSRDMWPRGQKCDLRLWKGRTR